MWIRLKDSNSRLIRRRVALGGLWGSPGRDMLYRCSWADFGSPARNTRSAVSSSRISNSFLPHTSGFPAPPADNKYERRTPAFPYPACRSRYPPPVNQILDLTAFHLFSGSVTGSFAVQIIAVKYMAMVFAQHGNGTYRPLPVESAAHQENAGIHLAAKRFLNHFAEIHVSLFFVQESPARFPAFTKPPPV